MRRTVPNLIVFLSFFFLSPIAEVQSAETLTWNQCIEEVTRNNPDLRSAQMALESAQSQVNSTYSGFLPQVSGSLSSSRGETTGLGLTYLSSTYSATVSATQNLFTGFQSVGALNQAQASLRVSEANLKAVKAAVSNALKNAYMGLLYAQNYLKLIEEIIHRREENLQIVQLQFENGSENKGDLLLSEAHLKEARFNRIQAQDSIQVSTRQLAQVLGRDDLSEIHLVDEIPVTAPDPTFDVKKLALQTPDHLQATAQEDLANASATVARSALYPSLGLSGSVGPTGPSFFPTVNANTTNAWSVGINLTYTFFNGGHDYFSTKASVESWKAASATRESVDRGLLTKLKQAYFAYYEAVERVKVDEAYLEASTIRERIGKAKYNNGLLSFVDWDIIENDLIDRETTLLSSRKNRVLMEAAWEQAQGKGVIP